MAEVAIEQALHSRAGPDSCRCLARSPGFAEDWLPQAERLCVGFGERPAGVSCPAAVFAQPFGNQQVAIVQVADQGPEDSVRPPTLAFHLLILSRNDYANLGGDPFLLADRFPAPWHKRGDLPSLCWSNEPLPRRTVQEVQRVLQPKEESAFLLGATQALVDGGRLVVERSAPALEMLRGLWSLLPFSTRCQLWPASFAFGNKLGFHIVAVPHADPMEFAGYLTEQQAGDYPEGRYELGIQIAAEAGDQRELDSLFARRSRQETWKMGLLLLALSILLVFVSNWIIPAFFPARKPSRPAEKLQQKDSENQATKKD